MVDSWSVAHRSRKKGDVFCEGEVDSERVA